MSPNAAEAIVETQESEERAPRLVGEPHTGRPHGSSAMAATQGIPMGMAFRAGSCARMGCVQRAQVVHPRCKGHQIGAFRCEPSTILPVSPDATERPSLWVREGKVREEKTVGALGLLLHYYYYCMGTHLAPRKGDIW